MIHSLKIDRYRLCGILEWERAADRWETCAEGSQHGPQHACSAHPEKLERQCPNTSRNDIQIVSHETPFHFPEASAAFQDRRLRKETSGCFRFVNKRKRNKSHHPRHLFSCSGALPDFLIAFLTMPSKVTHRDDVAKVDHLICSATFL